MSGRYSEQRMSAFELRLATDPKLRTACSNIVAHERTYVQWHRKQWTLVTYSKSAEILHRELGIGTFWNSNQWAFSGNRLVHAILFANPKDRERSQKILHR